MELELQAATWHTPRARRHGPLYSRCTWKPRLKCAIRSAELDECVYMATCCILFTRGILYTKYKYKTSDAVAKAIP
jgi:hypothetical protein